MLSRALASVVVAQSAPPTPFPIRWTRGQGAEACASREELTTRLTEILGPDAIAAEPMLEGRVQRVAETAEWVATIRTAGDAEDRGERELRSSAQDCAALTPSITLVFALALQSRESGVTVSPDATGASAAAEVAPAPSSAVAQAAPPPHRAALDPELLAMRPPANVAPKLKPERGLELGSALVLAQGLLPSAAFGLNVLAAWTTTLGLSLQAAALFWLPQTVSFDADFAPGAVAFRAMQGELSACVPLVAANRWRVQPCAGGLLGRRTASATDLPVRDEVRRRYGGGLAGFDVHYALSKRISVFIGGRLALSGPRLHFTYRDVRATERTLYRPGLWMLWGHLGAAIRFY